MAGSALPLASNQAVSALTQTSPKSIGTSRPESSALRASASVAGRASAVYGAMTPSASARPAKVLSMPKTTSPSGESFVRTSWLVSVPASPGATKVTSSPESASNCVSSSSVRLNESCVTTVSVVGAGASAAGEPAGPDGVAAGEATQDASASEARPASAARAGRRYVDGMVLLLLRRGRPKLAE